MRRNDEHTNLGLVLLNNRDHLRLDAIPQLLNLFIGLAKRNFSIVEIYTNGLYARASLVGYLDYLRWIVRPMEFLTGL
jgi:hypothetical protein